MHRRRSNRDVIENSRYRLPERQRQHLLRVNWHDDRVARPDLSSAMAEPEAAVPAGHHVSVSTHNVDVFPVRL